MLTPIVSMFCLLFFLYQIAPVASSTPYAYVPVDDITLDCGSATSCKSKGMDGHDWTGDFQSKFFSKEELNNFQYITSQVPKQGLINLAPFTSARISYSLQSPMARNSFSCTFTRPLTQVLRCLRTFSLSKQVCSPYLETSVLPFLLALCRKIPLSKEFCVNVEENQKLNLLEIYIRHISLM